MKRIFILLLLTISLQAFSTNWLGWGYQGFNSSGTPYNWSQSHIHGNSNWVTYGGLYTPYEGSGNMYFSTLVSTIGDTTMLISKPFANNGTGISNSLFTFWHQQKDFGGNNNELKVYYRTSTTSAWVLLESYTTAFNNWTQELIMLPAASATMQLGFEGILKGGSSSEGVALDIVSIMYLNNTCSFPINFDLASATGTSATIEWEESGTATTWSIEYGAYGYTQGTGTTVNGINTTPSYTITGLSAGSQYDAYVRASCGSTTSDWVGPISFFTPCDAVTVYPYLETFDNSSFDNDDWNNGFTVNCWTEDVGQITQATSFTGANSDWKPGEYGVPTDYNPSNSNSAMCRTGYGHSWLFSPIFDLGTTHNYQLEFDIALTYYTSSTTSYSLSGNDTISVVISTDGGITWNKTNILKTWDATTNPSQIPVTGIHEIVNLGSYSNVIKVAFYVSGNGTAGYVYIDNVRMTTFSTAPILEVLTPEWIAGPQLINGTDTSGVVMQIRNSGVDTLFIDSITDLSSTEFTSTFNTSIALDSGEVYTFSFDYTPTDLIDDSLNFIIYSAYGVDTILLKGTAYELAPCEIEIGTDNQEKNLPLNFNYENSFSQTIFLQSEIDKPSSEVKKIYFYYNGNIQFVNQRKFTIYMKHTSSTSLSGWENILSFDSLATDTLDLTDEGWYEIDLGAGFAYNNTDNIVIAVNTQKVAGQTYSKQDMYSHNAPNGNLMSLVTYSSSTIDFNYLPVISAIAYRPNVRFCLESHVGIVNSTNNRKTISIYPNPANSQITIANIKTNVAYIEILDIAGKTIKQLPTNGLNQISITISGLSKGVYFIKSGTDFKKFIKN
ncbi:MAG: T9SS type A sorting domain-containing protein [Bacteroidales bacterium]|nr:T9SS type A sorting domain-containing protein [Bacteroidales bacterium]